MFDVGFWELAIIGVVALVIVGPERLPGLARTAGLWVGKARRMISDVKRDIDRELKASEMSELSTIKKDIDKAGEEVRQAAESVKESSGVDEVESSLKQTFKDAAPIEQELDELDQAAKEFSDELKQSPDAVDNKAEAAAEISPESPVSESSGDIETATVQDEELSGQGQGTANGKP
ncbi:MAG: Sec-independent protein translocase protein TatB [bacterium]